MATAVAPAGNGTTEKPEVTIVNEIPQSLDRALLLIVKNFFSQEHFLICYYIMQATCIREENLRNKLNYDQKELRQKLANLKAEKLVKERLLQQKNDNGRSISIIFYFINYRAIINVLMYKIDHMRQKLEAKEKEDTQKALYKCTNCPMKYETLEVDRLFDSCGNLKCIQCRSPVITDESGGPTQVTRTLLAKFNEQLQPLFFVAQELKGIQLAPHLLEPDITKYLDKDDSSDFLSLFVTNLYPDLPQQQDAVDFSGHGDRISLGGKAFSAHRNAPTLRYAHGDQIIVDLNADSSRKVVEEAKQVPLWLQDDAIAGSENAQAVASLNDVFESKNDVNEAHTSKITLEMLRELEDSEPVPKKIKIEDVVKKEEPSNGYADEADVEDEEEDLMVSVGGQQMPFSEVQGNEELIGRMSDEEREEYMRVFQEQFDM